MNRPVLVLMALLLLPGAASAAAATILFTVGKVEIQRDGQSFAARRGMPVEVGDKIETGPTGMTQLRFGDGALMALRHGSSLQVEDFALPAQMPAVATPALLAAGSAKPATAGSGRTVLRLVRGAFRTVTGLIGRGQGDDYRVVTPAATIGIRGTHYSGAFCEQNCGRSKPGLYVGVSEGEIVLENDAGSTPVGAGEYAYTPDAGTQPEPQTQPPEALDAPPAAEEEGEGAEDAESTPEGDAEGGADTGTPGDGPADTPAPEPEFSSPGTSSAEPSVSTQAAPPPLPPDTYRAPPNTPPAHPAHYAYSYTADRGADTTGVDRDGTGRMTGFLREANVRIGTAANTASGQDPVTGLSWGRWSAGVATRGVQPVDLGGQSLHWIYADPQPPVLPMEGSVQFTLVGNTDPTDSRGNRGFLGTATLGIDLLTGQVDSTLSLGISSSVWQAEGSGSLRHGAPLFGGLYQVTVRDAAGTVLGGAGGFEGFLSGTGAGLAYGLTAGSQTVTGVAAFEQLQSSPVLVE